MSIQPRLRGMKNADGLNPGETIEHPCGDIVRVTVVMPNSHHRGCDHPATCDAQDVGHRVSIGGTVDCPWHGRRFVSWRCYADARYRLIDPDEVTDEDRRDEAGR